MKCKCHHCHCEKPLYECTCDPEHFFIICKHCELEGIKKDESKA